MSGVFQKKSVMIEQVYDLFVEKPSWNMWERFFAKFACVNWVECWPWLAYKTPTGYGRFSVARSESREAHRLMATWMYGDPKDSSLVADHLICDNRSCVNPLHLMFVPFKLNIVRKKGMSQSQAEDVFRVCGNGHSKNPATWYQSSSCKICHKEKYRQKKLAVL